MYARRIAAPSAVMLTALLLCACGGKSSSPPVPSFTPIPLTPLAQGACVQGASTAGTVVPSPLPSAPAPVTIDSNPQGLTVEIDSVFAGQTPLTKALIFSSALHKITVLNGAGGQDFFTCFQQNGQTPATIFFNRVADTTGSTGTVQSTANARRAEASADAALVRRPVAPARDGQAFVPDVFVVAYDAARTTNLRVAAAVAHAGALFAKTMTPADAPRQLQVVRVSAAQLASAMQAAAREPGVVSVDRVAYRRPATTAPISPLPSNPHFTADEQWDMFAIGMPNAWAYSPPAFGSPSVKVAVIDTGIDTAAINTDVQTDLIAHVTYAEQDLSGVKTVCATLPITGCAAVQDHDGHGTNVAGIAAAAIGNAGYAGVAPNVDVQIFEIFDSTGNATTADEAQAILDAVAQGAQVINLSLGESLTIAAAPDPTEEAAVEYALAHNVTVVAAAGNDRASGISGIEFPAAYPGVIAVGATSLRDNNSGNPSGATEYVASYSNSGPNLALVAPGGDPGSNNDSDFLHWIGNVYSTTGNPPCTTPADCRVLIAGTSQATPHVSGAAALLLSVNPSLAPPQIASLLESTADNLSDPNQGHGRLNVYRALAALTRDPKPPSYLPSTTQLVAFAYTNSGAVNAAPQIADVTFSGGMLVNANGSFRIADIPASAPSYRIGVWYDANGDGKIDAGDLFGASGPCTPSAPCASATGINVSLVTGSSFSLP